MSVSCFASRHWMPVRLSAGVDLKATLFTLQLFLLSVFAFNTLQAEGTRQIAPTPDDITMLLTSRPDFSNFAAFNGPADSRLYISVKDVSEQVFIGLTSEYNDRGVPLTDFMDSRYHFRIRRVNSAGTDPVVHGPFTIDRSSANVTDWSDAAFGAYPVTLQLPNPAKGNQMDFVFQFTPDQPGDYYIEFQDTGDDNNEKVLIGYWDITVANGGTPVDGRIWSQNWAFRTPVEDGTNPEECGWDRKFNGTLYSYTEDGFVSKIDFADSGFQGLAFTVAFNMTGPGNTGNFAEDRKSIERVNATNNAAQHKIFLHEPDPALFPDGECGTVNGSRTINCDGSGNYCLDVSVTRPGQVDIIIDFNDNGRFDPGTEDVTLVHCFPDGSALSACVPWDGLKGDGSAIEFGDQADLIYVYTQGVQNWAVYDGEFLKNGFCVEAVRPLCGDMSLTNVLYWDDRNISAVPGSGQPKDGRGGCECRTEGCRTWTNFNPNQECTSLNDKLTTGYGDKNTLNTWWFASVTRQVAENVNLLSCRINGDDQVCEGSSTEFAVEVSSATTALEYNWEGPGDFTAAGASSGPIGLAGTYCVTVTDENGCETVCCRELAVNENPVLNCSITDVSCFEGKDGAINAQVSGGTAPYTFSLNGGPSRETGVFIDLPAGDYTITVQDQEGCTAICEVRIGQPEPLACNISDLQDASCDGALDGSATVTAKGGNDGYSYLWDNGETTATATALAPGPHEVTVTDSKGCTTTCTLLIEGPAPLSCYITDVIGPQCAGESNGRAKVIPEGGNGDYTYAWDNGETTAGARQLSSGPHMVTVTDAKGCSTTCEVIIKATEPLSCTVTLTQAIFCLGENSGQAIATASGGNDSYNYQWDNGEEGALATALSAGIHTVTVTDGRGCTTTCTVDVTAPLVEMNCKITDVLPVRCGAPMNGSATVVVEGGNGTYTYEWDNGETTATATQLSRGLHAVTVSDGTGCTTTCEVQIDQVEDLSCWAMLLRDVTCQGNNNGKAEAFPKGGVAPYQYEWDNGEKTKVAENLSPGQHVVTITDQFGCTTTCSVYIQESFKVFSCWGMVDQNASCEGASDGVAFVMPVGGVEPYSYEWSNGGNSRDIEDLPAGTYSVTVTDAEGCRSVCVVGISEPKVALSCPQPLEIACADPDRDARIASWLQNVQIENACKDAPVITNSYEFAAFSGNCRAEQVVTFSYETPSGRVATCQSTITLLHESAPEMICPPDQELDCSDPIPATDFAGGKIIGSCGLEYDLEVRWTGDEITGGTGADPEVITRTYEATDNCGNTVSCRQRIVIAPDNSAPPVIEPTTALEGLTEGSTVQVEARFDQPGWEPVPFKTGDVTATDTHRPVSVRLERTLLEESGTCSADGYLQRWEATWVATDACGQQSTFTLFVEVVDTTTPAIIGNVEEKIEVPCDAIPDPVAPAATDNGFLAEVRLEETFLTPICNTEYTLARTWTPVDACGNEGAPFTQTIVVSRVEGAPRLSFSAPGLQHLSSGDTYITDCSGLTYLLNNSNVIEAESPCGTPVSITFDPQQSQVMDCDVNQPGEYQLSWTARDECGNTSSFLLNVEVVDEQAPVLFFTNEAFVGTKNGETIAVSCDRLDDILDNADFISAEDNCDADPSLTVETVRLEGADRCGPYAGPAYEVTWQATDACGNQASMRVKLAVIDNTPPVFQNVPPNLCTDELPPVSEDITAVDECGGQVAVSYEGERINECFGGGMSVVRTWVAYDECGNRSSYSQYITYDDPFPPYFRVLHPENNLVIYDGDEVTLPYDCNSSLPYGMPELFVRVYDFCQKDLSYETEVLINRRGDCKEAGFINRVIVTYSAVDNCGNATSMTFTARLVDQDAPVFDPSSLEQTASCTSLLPEPRAYDCDPNVTLTLLSATPDGDPCDPATGSVTRTWQATDACGNTSTAEQVVHFTSPATLKADEEEVDRPEEPVSQKTTLPAGKDPTVQKAIVAYPNPGRGYIFLDLGDYAGRRGRLRVRNVMGQTVFETRWDEVPDRPQSISLHAMAGGVYTAVLRLDNGETQRVKFIVSR